MFKRLLHLIPLSKIRGSKLVTCYGDKVQCNNEEQYMATCSFFEWNKYVYKLEYELDGSFDQYKACLVAKAFNQTQGIDYFETFNPVVKALTILIVLTLVLSFWWSIQQLDIQNAFLNGDLEEQVFISRPSGFVGKQFPFHVYKA